MPEKVNVGVCEMRKLSRAPWWGSFTAGQSLPPVWAIPNNMARADLTQQRYFSPLPQHPIEVWSVFLICLFATEHGLRSAKLECWLAGQGHGAPVQLCPHMHPGGAPHTQQWCWTPTAPTALFPQELLQLNMTQDSKAQLYFVNVLQTRLFLSS